MPKTRNVTRAQWDAANTNASHASTSSRRSRSQNENINESEKENSGRQPGRAGRLHATTSARGPLGVLGAGNASTITGSTTSGKSLLATSRVSKPASKGKGKPTATPQKRKKQPLQDITDQFLPAPEAANRAEEHRDIDEEALALMHQEPSNIISALPPVEAQAANLPAPVFTSPLPPSSPPSDYCPRLPAYQESELEIGPLDHAVSPTHSIPVEEYDPWQEFDGAQPVSRDSPKAISNSDPFGFLALERKLKVEREAAKAAISRNAHDSGNEEEEQDDVAHVLVADTSSPRLVRRLKRPLGESDGSEPGGDDAPSDSVAPVVLSHTHYLTPPTPHKDKQKRRRLSHEGRDVFSPCSSSVESSPSPSKASARKRPCPDLQEDPLDEFNEELDRSREVELCSDAPHRKPKTVKRCPGVEGHKNMVDPQAISMNLRTRTKRATNDEGGVAAVPLGDANHAQKAIKGKATKKPVSKARATAAKKAANKEKADADDDEEEDLDEKWERERQERVDYFKRLEEYQVEKEDVYLI